MISTRLILEEVARFYKVKPNDITSRRREPSLFLPRRMGWRLARELTSLSLSQIGRHMGGFDHSTVLHGLRRVDADSRNDPALRHDFETLRVLIERVKRSAAEEGDDVAVTAPAIARRLLETPLVSFDISMLELRTLCEELLYLHARIASVEDTKRHAIRIAREAVTQRDASAVVAKPILDAARALAARAVDVDRLTHTSSERLARQKLSDAITHLKLTVKEATHG